MVTYSKTALQEKIDELTASLQAAQRALEDAQNNKRKMQLEGMLSKTQGQQGQETTYESAKRELENAIQNGERTVTQLQQQVPMTPNPAPDPTPEPTQSTEPPEAAVPIQQPEELSPETAVDGEQLAVLKAQPENLLADEARLQNAIDATADPTDQLASLRLQRRSTERNIMEDSTQIAEDIQKKQSQIDNLQEQINALSAKEEKIDSLKGQIEKAIEDMDTANFDLETQRIALETLNNAIENAQAEIRSINAELSSAQALLTAPSLTAKADGVVTLISYTEGDTVPAGKSVVTIGDSGEKCVAAEIPQEDIGGVELGQVVELQFVADPDNTISGRVIEKNLVPTQGTEGVTYTVKIAFDEPQEELLQDMTCSVRFIQKRVENVLTLANKAITLTDGKQTVTVQMPDGSHEEREIKTGFSDGRTSEVISGLSAGEIVVVEG